MGGEEDEEDGLSASLSEGLLSLYHQTGQLKLERVFHRGAGSLHVNTACVKLAHHLTCGSITVHR